jgi:hypothetical protein
MNEDKLTHAQRLRLEAFAQAGARNQMRPIPIQQQFEEAVMIEQWLWAADDYRQMAGKEPRS